ncbi:FG-GAP and VCBS repeat-containing protein [Streptomyces buecherae]|uniref:FG-GAP and VCBS repeat-containing protein n=1 Tax=Streptomyces buecherae TaxID=2763006 RepID=UPI0027E392CA|nr:FG-GAP and VCBS repeat-containing protein [Streptomyces buecherae]
MHPRSRTLAAALSALAATTALTLPTAHAAPQREAAPYDLNGDGFPEVVVGVANGTVDGHQQAGYVAVVPGSATGPATAERRTVSQASTGVPGAPEPFDQFGAHHTSADLDRDGYADLLVSVPGEDGPTEDAGRVVILWGATDGLGETTSVPGRAAYGRVGGHGLAVADVDGDGARDIVTADDGEELATLSLARGPFAPGRTPAPLTRVTDTGITHFSSVVALAVGDLDGDGRDDVVAPWRGLEGDGTAMLRGTPDGLARQRAWHHETGGQSIAAGDFDRDGYADLAVGGARSVGPDDPGWEPRYPVASGVGGTVRVLYGGPEGPAGSRKPADFSQETPGVPGTGAGESERGDDFGFAVSAADADADGHADLAVGAPGEAAGPRAGAGRVTLLYGSPTGLRADRSHGVHQDAPGVPGSSEARDAFGAKVVLRDADGDRRADLHTAATGEDGGDGRVWSLFRAADDGAVTGVGYSAAGLHLPAPTRGLEFGRGLGN